MQDIPRRQLLSTVARGLGLTLIGLVPSSISLTRKAFAQTQRAGATTLSPADTARLKSVLERTTQQNAVQILKGSNLPDEDRLAVLAVRQLNPDEVRASLDRMRELAALGKREAAGQDCGIDCGGRCGRECGSSCGDSCGSICDGSQVSATGSFCGGGCTVRPGTIGVLDRTRTLGLDFTAMDIQRVCAAVTEAQRLAR